MCLSHNLCSSHHLDRPVVNGGIRQWLFSWKVQVIAIWLLSHMGVQNKEIFYSGISPLQIYFSIRSLLKPKEAKMMPSAVIFDVYRSLKCNFTICLLCLFSRGVVALEYRKSNNYQVYYSWTRNCQRLSFCVPRSVFSSIKKYIHFIIYSICITSRLLRICNTGQYIYIYFSKYTMINVIKFAFVLLLVLAI